MSISLGTSSTKPYRSFSYHYHITLSYSEIKHPITIKSAIAKVFNPLTSNQLFMDSKWHLHRLFHPCSRYWILQINNNNKVYLLRSNFIICHQILKNKTCKMLLSGTWEVEYLCRQHFQFLVFFDICHEHEFAIIKKILTSRICVFIITFYSDKSDKLQCGFAKVSQAKFQLVVAGVLPLEGSALTTLFRHLIPSDSKLMNHTSSQPWSWVLSCTF